MSSIIKAQTNKYKWLASALNDTACLTDSGIAKRPKFTRYIYVLYGKAMATNGVVVHVLPTPELKDGCYVLDGLKLVKAEGVNVPPTYNPQQVVNKYVYLNYDNLVSKSIQDFKPIFLGRMLKLKRGGLTFNREYLTKATNHNERNSFEVASTQSGGFAFGVNEFGTFFVLALRKPSIKVRVKMAAIVLMVAYNKIIGRLS